MNQHRHLVVKYMWRKNKQQSLSEKAKLCLIYDIFVGSTYFQHLDE